DGWHATVGHELMNRVAAPGSGCLTAWPLHRHSCHTGHGLTAAPELRDLEHGGQCHLADTMRAGPPSVRCDTGGGRARGPVAGAGPWPRSMGRGGRWGVGGRASAGSGRVGAEGLGLGGWSVVSRNGRDAAGKQERHEVFVEYTKSICPVCKVVVDAQVNIRGNKVYLRKRCREHGWFEALVYGDAQAYQASARFNKPGTVPLTFQTEVREGCPSDCGLCPEHKQHACLGIIEVNTNCNLDCPICFADSGHQPDGYAITQEQCERMLDVFVASEGEAEVVMFSGGEPTIHKNILGFIDAAQARPIRNVTLNTNGIRLATDKAFAAALSERNGRPG